MDLGGFETEALQWYYDQHYGPNGLGLNGVGPNGVGLKKRPHERTESNRPRKAGRVEDRTPHTFDLSKAKYRPPIEVVSILSDDEQDIELEPCQIKTPKAQTPHSKSTAQSSPEPATSTKHASKPHPVRFTDEDSLRRSNQDYADLLRRVLPAKDLGSGNIFGHRLPTPPQSHFKRAHLSDSWIQPSATHSQHPDPEHRWGQVVAPPNEEEMTWSFMTSQRTPIPQRWLLNALGNELISAQEFAQEFARSDTKHPHYSHANRSVPLLPPKVKKAAPKDHSTQPSIHTPTQKVDALSDQDGQPHTDGPHLCREQSDLVKLIMSGRNVFFTGSAGTGKSTVLKEFVRRLREVGKDVQIVAPTGRAALDINGSTTWTYAGWTPDSMKKPMKALMSAAHGKFVHKRLSKTNVLVIDEISMVENLHFERLNSLMKEARGNGQAFGGVQLIVTGDFCQLPPVKPFQYCITCGHELAPLDSGAAFKCIRHGVFREIDKWAFRSEAWKECGFKHVQLSQIHRQKDEKFIKILQKCRISVPLSENDRDVLLNHKSETKNAVRLFATRDEVGRINQMEFCKLTSPKLTFLCHDYFRWNEEKHRNLGSKGNRLYDGSMQGLRDHRYETKLELKVGMLVVLLANLDITGGLVNGSQGVIVQFKKHEASDLLLYKRGNDNGLSTKPSKVDTQASQGREFAAIKEAKVKEFIARAPVKQWPVVRFSNGNERTIIADCTINELGDEREYSLLSRTQIPLSAAWAMSIHKAQGMTLDKVVVDLSKSFEEGQLYVALSRARSLEGLKVEGLGKWQGEGNEQVKEFLRQKFGI